MKELHDQVQLKLRFSEAMRRLLEHEAKRNRRSMNAEIVDRLTQSLLVEPLLMRLAEALDERDPAELYL